MARMPRIGPSGGFEAVDRKGRFTFEHFGLWKSGAALNSKTPNLLGCWEETAAANSPPAT